jgi:anaerobic selenocysteine-containing dehydrogenase
LESLEVLAVLDVVDTATTALATHILPCAAQLERSDLSFVLDTLQDRVMAQRTAAVVPAPAECRPSWWWFAKLAHVMSLDLLPAGIDWTDDALIDLIVAGSRNPTALADAPAIAVSNDIVFGWVSDRVIPGGRWRVAPPALVEELQDFLSASRPTLALVPRRRGAAINSRAVTGGDELGIDLPDLLVSPTDARVKGVVDGQRVKIRSGTRTMRAIARLTDDIVPGSVSMSHGTGNADVNTLTSAEDAVNRLTGMPLYSGIPVVLLPCDDDRGTSRD